MIRIGTQFTQVTAYIAGISNATVSGESVQIDPSTGQLGVITSSRRYKEDIEPMADASDRLLQLRPVQFRYKKPNAVGEKPIQYGLIAEDVQKVMPELVILNRECQPETVAYHLLPAMLSRRTQLRAYIAAYSARPTRAETLVQLARWYRERSECPLALCVCPKRCDDRAARGSAVPGRCKQRVAGIGRD